MNEQTRTRGPAGVEDTVRDFWASRPRRPHHGRKIAGVAAGVANRYELDPVVVRVALVVATVLGGFGVAVYLLGWLFFPDEHAEVSAVDALRGRGRSNMSRGLTIVLCVALFPALSWTFAGSWFHGGGLLGLGLILAALYALHRGRGQHNRPQGPPPAEHRARASFTRSDVDDENTGDTPTATGPTAATTSAWDPLAADPLAWDLPEAHAEPEPAPAPVRRRPRRRHGRAGVATLGLAVLVAGVGVGLTATSAAWFSVNHVVGLVLAVLGFGLVVGSFTGGGRRLIGLAIPLSVVGVVLTTVPMAHLPSGIGTLERTPTTTSALRPSYERGIGSVRIDLTELPPSPPVELSVHVGLGSATVVVPPGADVTYTCSTGMGAVDCLNSSNSGIGIDRVTDTRLGGNGTRGQNITVDVSTGIGHVEVLRG